MCVRGWCGDLETSFGLAKKKKQQVKKSRRNFRFVDEGENPLLLNKPRSIVARLDSIKQRWTKRFREAHVKRAH